MKRTSMMICLALALCCTTACSGMADIRPDSLKQSSPTQAQSQKGRALVERMAATHGLETWKTFDFMQARAQDEWFNAFFYAVAAPYTENPERAHIASYTQQFPHARVEFLGGENRGEVWGVRGERLARKEGDEVSVFTQDEESLFATFMHNFLLWPNVYFQLASADTHAYLGEATWEGKTFDRVLVSWGDLSPQPDIDQWELWINRESGLLERVWFTTRLAGEGQTGGYNLRAFKTIQGMQIATVYEGVLALDEDPLHTYTYTEITFSNRVDSDLLSTIK